MPATSSRAVAPHPFPACPRVFASPLSSKVQEARLTFASFCTDATNDTVCVDADLTIRVRVPVGKLAHGPAVSAIVSLASFFGAAGVLLATKNALAEAGNRVLRPFYA